MSEAASSPSTGPFELSGGALCLDFANTWGDRARPESDRLHGYEGLLAFATQAGALAAGDAADLARRAARQRGTARRVLAAGLALREAIYHLLSAQARGRRVDPADLAALNAALGAALPHLRVARRDDGYGWSWDGSGDPLAAPLRPIARSAAELLTSDELRRVRECDGATCTWLFLDRSRNRSRRWCSMEGCGNRAKARRHYHRRTGRQG